MIELHPWAEADINGEAVVPIRGGQVKLDAYGVPYATATVEVGLTVDLELEDLDPRDDVRIIISAGNTGHWEWIAEGYGTGPYGHGPYGGQLA